ncbi:ABC transporter ATP-binding protein [Propionicicella superfundia]|uniref:ATP-binding cassette domain-containing protein n=1 Tax=Propionicicella superfundia TaxID=348582 RepID=UPI000403DFB3|nr:ABC transporter ATP-binding protein [Propionicicella superfundia]
MGRADRGARTPLDPAVSQASPRWVMICSATVAWLGAAATALLFVRLGAGIDTVAAGRAISVADIVLMAFLVLLAGLSAAGVAVFSVWSGGEAERRLRRVVVAGVFARGVQDAEQRSGANLSLATEGVERTAQYRAGFLGPVVGAVSTPLVVLVVMALGVDAVTAGWLTLLLLLVPLLIGGFQRIVSPVGTAYRRSQQRLTAAFLESIQALETLVYSRAGGRAAERLAHEGEAHRAQTMRLLAGNQLIIFVLDAAFSLAMIATGTVIAVSRVGAGALTAGEGIAIVLMTLLLVGPVDQVGKFFYVGIGGRASQRAISAHAAAARGAMAPDAHVASRDRRESPGSLVLDDVTAAWPDGPDILRRLSLRVEPGERVALVGPSGVGKSTVSALIQAHLLPRSGHVVVDGLDTAATDAARIRSRLAVVEQRTFLFLGSIADNLRLASPTATDEELWQALDVAGLRAEVADLPQGLASPVGEQGRLLSGGQAQRLAIARAALRNAPILVLDEPTSQVDLAAEAAILAALDRLAEGRTVLMIAHRPNAIGAADRVIDLGAVGAGASR